MRTHTITLLSMTLLMASIWTCGCAGGKLAVGKGNNNVVFYQAAPMNNPAGGKSFKGSNFIHPLKTPSGFTVTRVQAPDHLHHFGLWWPWKFVTTDDRTINCWELQQGEGLIQAVESSRTNYGFTARSVYIDRKAPGGAATLINETLDARLSDLIAKPAKGYFLDLEIIHEPVGSKPLIIKKYRYSGFSLRGTAAWNKDNSTVLTSEGLDYTKSNNSRARWVRIEGDSGRGNTSGIILMSSPQNHNHPEHLRTWDPKTENGAIFINFNPVQNESWTFEPGKKYTRRYRVFVYDGKVSADEAEKLWQEYCKASK